MTLLNRIGCSICLLALSASIVSCGGRDRIPMQVELSRSVSKLPFVIAYDKDLYEKYGLDIDIRMEQPEFDGGISMPSKSMMPRAWRGLKRVAGLEEPWEPHIKIAGANGQIFDMSTRAGYPRMVSVAATDCVVRAHIVARKGIERMEELKGKRLGVSGMRSNSGYIALLLAERMGWDTFHDLSIMTDGNSLEALRNGYVDAFVASERDYAVAMQEGYPVLEDDVTWGEPLAGNSVSVDSEWLKKAENREAVRRFLQAAVEGIALFHNDRELTLEVLERWHGISDRTYAYTVYESGQSIPRKPYPCYEGTAKAMERYDSLEMRKYKPEDFYDDSLIRELDESGFIDNLYTGADMTERK